MGQVPKFPKNDLISYTFLNFLSDIFVGKNPVHNNQSLGDIPNNNGMAYGG